MTGTSLLSLSPRLVSEALEKTVIVGLLLIEQSETAELRVETGQPGCRPKQAAFSLSLASSIINWDVTSLLEQGLGCFGVRFVKGEHLVASSVLCRPQGLCCSERHPVVGFRGSWVCSRAARCAQALVGPDVAVSLVVKLWLTKGWAFGS